MIVVFPFSIPDQDLALQNLQWINELGGCKGHQCLLMHDRRCTPDLVSSIRQEAFKAFDNVETLAAGAEIDGWPAGANYFFRLASGTLQGRPQWRYFFWMEPDAIPLQKGWLDTLEAEFKRAGKPFMGDRVEVENIPLHMSGVGFYPNPLHAYAGEAYRAHETAWDMAGREQIVPRAHFTKLIEHAWRHPPYSDPHELETQIRKEAVLFHASKDGSLIDLLRKKKEGDATCGLPVIQTVKSNDAATVQPAAASPICDIFIKTYAKDAEWLSYCQRSIARFAIGFRKVIVIDDKKEYCEDGYLSQQIYKVYADTFTDADWILHIDSDTMFTRPVTPEIYLIGDKPRWMITPNSEIEKSLPWFSVMREFMGENAEFEFMRRFPFIFPRWFYAAFRQFILTQHGVDAETYIKNRPFRAFSEFNCMGAFAYKFFRDKFHWIDTSKDPWPELTVDQLWSHGGLTEEIKGRREKILSGGDHAGRIAENSEGQTPSANFTGKTIRIKILPGDIWALEGDQISGWVESENRLDHDQNFLPFVLRHINKGDRVIDIGAHIGDHAIAYARKAGLVYAFEPNPLSFECLSHNLAAHKDRVFLYEVALGDKTGKVPLSGNNGQPGGGYIGTHMKVADVEMRRLDDFKIKPNFIKIDVEGYEPNVLRGAEATITANRPVMVIEVNFGALRRQGNVPGDIFHWLEAHDYSYSIIQENCGSTSPMYDILCVPVKAPVPDETVPDTNDLLTQEQMRHYVRRIGEFSASSLANKCNVMQALVYAGLKERRRKKRIKK
jgi:FkbM family methyltransferase